MTNEHVTPAGQPEMQSTTVQSPTAAAQPIVGPPRTAGPPPTAGPAPTAALRVAGLSCGYRGAAKPVLAELNLKVAPGRFVCVIGPNGVGKSTLARTLAGLLPPVAGDIQLQDKPLGNLAPAERARNVSVVLTRLPVTGYLTVRSFVEMGRHPYTGTLGTMSDADHEAVDRALSQVGIVELAERWLNAISDGERQRAAIARAFAQAATLMILDEPTAFLDVESRAVVMTTLRDVAHKTGRTVIATSHDIDLVLRIADEIWMITPDNSVITGAPEDLVLAGAMDQVFPNHVLEFDLERGIFRLPHPRGREVTVVGEGDHARWTAHALERIGMRIRPVATPDAAPGATSVPGATPDGPVVTLLNTDHHRGPGSPPGTAPTASKYEWLLRQDGVELNCQSIAELVDHLHTT